MTSELPLAVTLVALLAGCGASTAPAPPRAPSIPALETAAPPAEATAVAAADGAHAAPPAEATRVEKLDPLAVDGLTEAATVPQITLTPAKELRRKSRADLDAALVLAKRAPSVDAAVDALEKRLGKPTWTESLGGRRVWIAPDGVRCHRLVVDGDGDVELEVAPADEWKMLSAAARQRLCSGEIKHGL